MNIALFGKNISGPLASYVKTLIDKLLRHNCSVFIYEPYFKVLSSYISLENCEQFISHEQIKNKMDFLFSIGGDGTLLDTITLVRDSGIPVLGINLGRMGFLSSVSPEKINDAVEEVINKKYSIEKRSLIHLDNVTKIFGELNYALNEVAIYKKEPSSMLLIHVTVDNKFLNSYWADGLIIATPTGSTAYSLSCGGPIIAPESENFIISPIASHNLTVRPIVIPDKSVVKVKVEGKDQKSFFIGLDSRTEAVATSVELIVKKENFTMNLVKLSNENFFSTIRQKLMWGLDIRN